MSKEFKVVRVTHNWSSEKLRIKMEETLNKLSKAGWDVVSISILANTYTAMITLSK